MVFSHDAFEQNRAATEKIKYIDHTQGVVQHGDLPPRKGELDGVLVRLLVSPHIAEMLCIYCAFTQEMIRPGPRTL